MSVPHMPQFFIRTWTSAIINKWSVVTPPETIRSLVTPHHSSSLFSGPWKLSVMSSSSSALIVTYEDGYIDEDMKMTLSSSSSTKSRHHVFTIIIAFPSFSLLPPTTTATSSNADQLLNSHIRQNTRSANSATQTGKQK